MENFIIWINKNLSKLIIGIIVICFVISFINSLKVNVSKQENMINTAIYSNTGIEDIEIVREFINYCSTGNKEKAYNLLSESSKKNLYQNENKFEQLYYDKKWKNSKNIKITNLKDNIFKVEAQRIYEVQNITVEIEDICSVVLENGYKKININNFIKEEKLDKKISIDNIQISAIKRQEYLNYEVYQLFVENKAKSRYRLFSGGHSVSTPLLPFDTVIISHAGYTTGYISRFFFQTFKKICTNCSRVFCAYCTLSPKQPFFPFFKG